MSNIREIKFNNRKARRYLDDLKEGKHMFTLRCKRIEGIRKVNDSYMCVRMEFEKEIGICDLNGTLWANRQLLPYVERSGFYEGHQDRMIACVEWLEALQSFGYRDIPECKTGKKRTFILLKATRKRDLKAFTTAL